MINCQKCPLSIWPSFSIKILQIKEIRGLASFLQSNSVLTNRLKSNSRNENFRSLQEVLFLWLNVHVIIYSRKQLVLNLIDKMEWAFS